MKRYLQVSVALLACITIMGSNITAMAEELTPEQRYINESLATLGVNSPFYDTSFLEKSDQLVNEHYIDGLIIWMGMMKNEDHLNSLNLEQYADISDPYWKLCILNNYKNTDYAEAPASTGVINCMQTQVGYGVRIDGSNMAIGTGDFTDVGITQEEVDALPVYPITDSWKPVNLVFTDEFYQYTETVSDLVWKHSGTYGGMRMHSNGVPLVTSEEGGVPLGLIANQYWENIYAGKVWTDAVTKCKVSMKYSYATPESGPYHGCQSFQFIALPTNSNWSSQQWRLTLYGIPNEMDWKIIHSVLNAITPDAEVIYQALRIEWGDPLGYGPWKYWDKWYDIGEQSRIRTWRDITAETTINSYRFIANGPQLTKYYYDIAPRDNGATVDLNGREIMMEQRYGAKYY